MFVTRMLVAAALVSSLPRAPCEHADLAGGPVRRARGGSLDVTRRVDVGVSTPELEAVYTLRDDVVDAVDDWMAEVTGVVPDKSSSGKPMHKLARRRRMVPGRGTEEVTQDTGLRKEKDVVEWLEDMIGVGEGGAEQRCMDPEVEPALQLSVPWCAWEDDTTVEANLEMVSGETFTHTHLTWTFQIPIPRTAYRSQPLTPFGPRRSSLAAASKPCPLPRRPGAKRAVDQVECLQ
jgi:hypothetical protein